MRSLQHLQSWLQYLSLYFYFISFFKITRAPVNAVQEASGNAFVMFETFLLSTGLHSECYCCEPT